MFNFIFTADKASKKPLYEQLYSYVADEIKIRILKKMSVCRQKSIGKISRNKRKYRWNSIFDFGTGGYLRAVARSGFYVCKVDIPVGDRNFEYEEEQESVTAYKADFKTNKVDINSFPYSTWIKLSKEVMYSTPEYLNSGNVKGDYELREYCKIFARISRSKMFAYADCGRCGYWVFDNAPYRTFDRDKVFAVENPGYKKYRQYSETTTEK